MTNDEKLRGAALALIISDNQPRKVILTRRKLTGGHVDHNKWQLVGGAVEEGETGNPALALIREIEEELGWIINSEDLTQLGTYSIKNTDYDNEITDLYIFLLEISHQKEVNLLDPEASAVEWFKIASLADIEVMPVVSYALELISEM